MVSMTNIVTIPKKEYTELKKIAIAYEKEKELELVGKKIEKEKEEMKRKGLKYLSEEEALARYRGSN